MPPCRGQSDRSLSALKRKATTQAERTPPFSKHQLNQACSNAVAQDSDPLKAQLFGKQTLSNEASSDADRTFAARFGRSRFEAGSKGQPCSSPWQSSLPQRDGQGSQQIEARVQSACSMREFARRVRIARRVCSNRELVRTRTPHEQARRTARKAVVRARGFRGETGRNRRTTSLISARSWLSGETGRVW